MAEKGRRAKNLCAPGNAPPSAPGRDLEPGVRKRLDELHATQHTTTSELVTSSLTESQEFRLAFEETEARAYLVRYIAELRERRGYSQTDFAEMAGTTQSAVSEFEKGVVEPRLATVQRFVAALGARLEMQLWYGPLLLLNTWTHRSTPFSEWTLRSVVYSEAVSAVSIKNQAARVWFQPSAKLPVRSPASSSGDPTGVKYLRQLVEHVIASGTRVIVQDRRESNAGRLHDAEVAADPRYRRHFDDVTSRRRLIEFLAQRRLDKGMSQTQLSKLTGMSQSAISEFEKGVTEPRIASIQRWARAFGLRFELQVWVGPFVLFDSWIGRSLPYESVVVSVALNDHMALQWYECWLNAGRSAPVASQTIDVRDVIVEPTRQDDGERDGYVQELLASLGQG